MTTNKSKIAVTDFMEDSIGQKVDYPYILNRQIDRIALFGSQSQDAIQLENHYQAIEILDTLLEPYKDDTYTKTMNRYIAKIHLQLNQYEDHHKEQAYNQYFNHWFTKIKFSELVKLMSRKGFIPERRITSIDDEEQQF